VYVPAGSVSGAVLASNAVVFVVTCSATAPSSAPVVPGSARPASGVPG
jgi:hypothetical protein